MKIFGFEGNIHIDLVKTKEQYKVYVIGLTCVKTSDFKKLK